MNPSAGAPLQTPEAIRGYAFAGHATFTVVSKASGARRTFQLRQAPDSGGSAFFASLLCGPDNGSDYRYLGFVYRRGGMGVPATQLGGSWQIKPNGKGWGAEGLALLTWILRQIERADGGSIGQAEIWHTGRCGRCGRELTVPESIASGIGPVCGEREAA